MSVGGAIAEGASFGARGGAIIGAFFGPEGIPIGAGIGAVGGGLVTGVGYLWLERRMSQANSSAKSQAGATTTTKACATCCQRVVIISKGMSPEAAKHIDDAQAQGHPSVLTLDRPGADARRAASLKGIATAPMMDRDEYPPATFAEGGTGASVRLIPRSDNRSAGGQLGAQINGAPDGCKITIKTGP